MFYCYSSLSKHFSFRGQGVVIGRDTGDTVGVDPEVVLVHSHLEEAVVSPIGAPGVATNPVLFAGDGVLTVACHGDLVVDHGEPDFFRPDFTSLVVVLEVVGRMNSTGDGAVGKEFSLHLVDSAQRVVISNVVLGVIDGPAAIKAGFTLGGRRPGAVTADIDVFAISIQQVQSSILFA